VAPIIRGPGAHFGLDGRVTLDAVAHELDFRPSDVPGGIETMRGYARRRLQHAPEVNDSRSVIAASRGCSFNWPPKEED
jgi:CBS domain containing-hemolysin-like protein